MINKVGKSRLFLRITTILGLLTAALGQAQAATLKEAREFHAIGEYAKAIEACEKAIEAKEYDAGWRLLLLRARLATGQFAEAKTFSEKLLQDYRYRYNAEALWLFHLVFEANGETEQAKQMLQIIIQFLDGQRGVSDENTIVFICLLYTSPSPRDLSTSRMPSSA